MLYAKAAVNGQKVNSSIKDFAAVLHQCGYTREAIGFLEDMKGAYTGDLRKYERLIQNFEIQIQPTGRHNYVKIMIDLGETWRIIRN